MNARSRPRISCPARGLEGATAGRALGALGGAAVGKPWPEGGLRGGGFTLLELVVLVATVAVLVSVLLSSLARAEHKAQDLRCLNNLKQLGVALRMFADEHQDRLPEAEPLPALPIDPAHRLPRLCDLLAPHLGYLTNAMPTTHTVLRCPSDKAHRFEHNGSSYEWNALYSGRPIEHPRRSRNPPREAPLIFDYDNVHTGATNDSKNVLFADFHVDTL